MRQNLLFCGQGDMYGVVESRKAQVKQRVEQIPKNTLLSGSEEDLVAALVEDLRLDVPAISDEHLVETHETRVDVSRDPMRLILDPSRPFYVPGTEVVIAIPFRGDPAFFQIRPSTFSMNPPRGAVVGSELHLSYTRTDADGAAVKRQYDSDLAQIRSSLQALSTAAEQFHRELPDRVRTELHGRKNRILAAEGMVASLGVNLRRRGEAPATFAVPVNRRRARIEEIQVAATPFKPEPTLAPEEYEEILKILSNMAEVMERSPSAFVGMREEDLRTHFLVQLNGQYEGQATAETFNYEGKTDIHLRVEGRNVFIAECKYWNGPKEFQKAIDQLLSYLSWRDTKTALIVFNRNVNFSEVLATIQETVPTHAQFKRIRPKRNETSFRYVFGQPRDPNREMVVTVMAFDVPTQTSRVGKAEAGLNGARA